MMVCISYQPTPPPSWHLLCLSCLLYSLAPSAPLVACTELLTPALSSRSFRYTISPRDVLLAGVFPIPQQLQGKPKGKSTQDQTKKQSQASAVRKWCNPTFCLTVHAALLMLMASLPSANQTRTLMPQRMTLVCGLPLAGNPSFPIMSKTVDFASNPSSP